MRKWIFAILLVAAGSAYALTDYGCVNRCTQAGGLYQFCHSKCTVPDQQQLFNPAQQQGDLLRPARVKQIDFTCMRECLNAGSLYQYCEHKCSY